MAEKLCTLRTKGGGGGKYTETVLWTNPNPSSYFTGQQITLSDDVDNYDYIGITWAYSMSYTSSEYCEVAIYPVSDLKKAVTSSSVRKAIPAIASGMSNVYHRVFYYISNTKLQFIDCYQSGTSTATNAQTIPIQVVGIKVELPPTVGNVKTGTFTASSGTTVTVDCGFQPKKIYIYNLVGTTSMFVNIYDENVSSTYTIGAYRSSSSTNGCNSYALGGGNNGVIQSITDTGFTFKGSTVMSTLYYTAIG